MPVPRLRHADELLAWADQITAIVARQVEATHMLQSQGRPLKPPPFTPGNLPSAKEAGQVVTVNDGVLGHILLLSSGGVWRRVDNLAVYP